MEEKPVKILVIITGGTINGHEVIIPSRDPNYPEGKMQINQGRSITREAIGALLEIVKSDRESQIIHDDELGSIERANMLTALKTTIAGNTTVLQNRWANVTIDVLPLFTLDSSNMRQMQNKAVAAETFDTLSKAYDAVVVTYGTDTMDQFASNLSFMLQNLKKPVIITGSKLVPTKLHTDAFRNLIDSINFAIDVQSRPEKNRVFLVFDGKALEGCWAFQFQEGDSISFRSSKGEPFAQISGLETTFTLGYETSKEPNVGAPKLFTPDFGNIAIATVVLETEVQPSKFKELLKAVRRPKGVIVLGYHSNTIPGKLFAAIREIAREIPIVMIPAAPVQRYEPQALYKESYDAVRAGVILGVGPEHFVRANMRFTIAELLQTTHTRSPEGLIRAFGNIFKENYKIMHNVRAYDMLNIVPIAHELKEAVRRPEGETVRGPPNGRQRVHS